VVTLGKEYFSMLPTTPPQEHKKKIAANKAIERDAFFMEIK
jgi:hypothetical protein